MQSSPIQKPKRWLALLLAGILLFAGGGGTGYMFGQQRAKAQQTQQMKRGPHKMSGQQPSGRPKAPATQSSK